MNSKQHLYYALGILAYSIALADGKVQREELQELEAIVNEDSGHQFDVGYADIIFRLLNSQKHGEHKVYDWAMSEFENGRHHLTGEMIEKFTRVINRVAEAYPPTTQEEEDIIQRFKVEIRELLPNIPII